eukprot:scaffold8.g1527.t1
MEVDAISLKRSSGSCSSEEENLQLCSRGKRRATAAACTARPEPQPQEIQAFLAAQGLSAPQLCGRHEWHCLAELNLLLASFQHAFPELTLLQARAFCRASKPTLLAQLAGAAGAAGGTGALAAAAAVLEGWADCSDVSLSLLELALPPFLACWAAKWTGGGAPPASLRLAEIRGYGHAPRAILAASTCYNLGQPAISSQAPARTIFIPLL